MKTRIFNLIILDESGSMSSIEKEAISGVNETIQTICSAQNKFEDQEHIVSLVSFNSGAVKSIYDCIRVNEVKNLTNKEYVPNCCTPLYDAMGNALTKLRKKVAQDDKVLVTIITDGYENSSKEYSGAAIKTLVESLRAKGWVFTYIGANQDVEKVASSISINNVMKFHTTSDGTNAMFNTGNHFRMKWFDNISKGVDHPEDDFFSEDDK